MDNTHQIEKLQQEMQQSDWDIRAESQLALALENGIMPDDFFIACDSLFYREYSKDIRSFTITEDAQKADVLELHLTRGGIYDQLPEGLFYQPVKPQAHSFDAAGMAACYKADKQKEQQARRFFMPLENDFFRQRIELEKEESRLLQGVQSGELNDYFTKFWGIPSSLPKSFSSYLIVLMPHVHRIAGNFALTAQCLQAVLQEEVSLKKIPTAATLAYADASFELGKHHLGIDTVCGWQFYEDYPEIQCTIGPLKKSNVSDYLQGGNKEELLETFCSFFMPAGATVVTKIIVAKDKEHMLLQEEAPVLGYSSVL